MVRADYDREADALYIRLTDRDTDRTEQVDDYRILDIAADGSVVGLEILYPARNLRIARLAEEYGFAEQLNAIDAAVADAIGGFAPAKVTTSIAFVLQEVAGSAALTGGTTTSSTSSTTVVDDGGLVRA